MKRPLSVLVVLLAVGAQAAVAVGVRKSRTLLSLPWRRVTLRGAGGRTLRGAGRSPTASRLERAATPPTSWSRRTSVPATAAAPRLCPRKLARNGSRPSVPSSRDARSRRSPRLVHNAHVIALKGPSLCAAKRKDSRSSHLNLLREPPLVAPLRPRQSPSLRSDGAHVHRNERPDHAGTSARISGIRT